MPFNVEPLNYIYSSSHPVAVDGDLRSDGGLEQRLSFLAVPNPVRFSTVISFNLPRAGAYSLKVFNLVGQQVKVFAGMGKAGANAITWNVAAVPNGVYFYQLGFEDKTTTQRMVVLK
ncbi:MAG: T9SS type A sorting domain-containing protein [Candidatus Edwardsbacteria bacterium]|nr:T9SS type A sorting domain-containing protein [Candidatus Edwardsbacteria bacterium]